MNEGPEDKWPIRLQDRAIAFHDALLDAEVQILIELELGDELVDTLVGVIVRGRIALLRELGILTMAHSTTTTEGAPENSHER